METCEHLDELFNEAVKSGIVEYKISTGWTKLKKVIEFTKPENDQTEYALKSACPPLKYYSYSGTPHNKPEHGVVCTLCKVGLSFPVENP